MLEVRKQAVGSGWRRERGEAALVDVFRTIRVAPTGTAGPLRKLAAFMGPGYLVAVGYMDPGNWATDLAGGAGRGRSLDAPVGALPYPQLRLVGHRQLALGARQAVDLEFRQVVHRHP